MKNRKVNALARSPQLIYQRLGIEFAIEREKYRHSMREYNRGKTEHSGRGLLTVVSLLFRGQRATTLSNQLTNFLPG